jgi:pimeloyl-ACP methyl ester carboxylesterase
MGRRSSRGRKLLLLAVLGGVACNVIAQRERSYARRLHRNGFEQRELRLGADHIAFWEGGEGPPVLLVHGFGASAIWQWREQMTSLADHHRVIAPDLLWFGGSSSTDPDPSISHQVDALLALLQVLRIETTHIIGASYGGIIAFELAAAHPDRVGRLVLVDSPGRSWTRADHEAMLERFDVERATDLFVPRDEAGVRRLFELAFYRPPRVPAWAARQALEELFFPYAEHQAKLLDWLEHDHEALVERSASINAPTLVVWGAEDPVFPLETGRRLAADLGAEIFVQHNARHAPNVEHPKPFNRAVLRLLATPIP